MPTKGEKWFFGLSITFIILLLVYKAAPYILLFNSVPGQKDLNDVKQLQKSVDIKRIPAVSDELRQQVLSDFAVTDFSQLGNRYRNQAMRTFRTVLALQEMKRYRNATK